MRYGGLVLQSQRFETEERIATEKPNGTGRSRPNGTRLPSETPIFKHICVRYFLLREKEGASSSQSGNEESARPCERLMDAAVAFAGCQGHHPASMPAFVHPSGWLASRPAPFFGFARRFRLPKVRPIGFLLDFTRDPADDLF